MRIHPDLERRVVEQYGVGHEEEAETVEVRVVTESEDAHLGVLGQELTVDLHDPFLGFLNTRRCYGDHGAESPLTDFGIEIIRGRMDHAEPELMDFTFRLAFGALTYAGRPDGRGDGGVGARTRRGVRSRPGDVGAVDLRGHERILIQ